MLRCDVKNFAVWKFKGIEGLQQKREKRDDIAFKRRRTKDAKEREWREVNCAPLV